MRGLWVMTNVIKVPGQVPGAEAEFKAGATDLQEDTEQPRATLNPLRKVQLKQEGCGELCPQVSYTHCPQHVFGMGRMKLISEPCEGIQF